MAFLSTGCAARYGVPRSALPHIPADGPIAIVADLQPTSSVEKCLGREDNADEQVRLLASIAEELPAALVVVGDLVFQGAAERDWLDFDAKVESLDVPVLPALGNHDYFSLFGAIPIPWVLPAPVSRRFDWLKTSTTYSIRHGDLAMLFLDSEQRLEPQSEWLRNELWRLAREGIRAALIFAHRPGRTNSSVVEPKAQMRRWIERTAVVFAKETGLTTVLFHGHAHGFERFRIDGVDVVVTAGGGGPRQKPREDTLFNDLYQGLDCRDGLSTMRPLNYVLASVEGENLVLKIMGLCRDWDRVRVLERLQRPLSRIKLKEPR